jgi:hypothetical protein
VVAGSLPLLRPRVLRLGSLCSALHGAGFDPAPPVKPVLCFVNAEWPLFRPDPEGASRHEA